MKNYFRVIAVICLAALLLTGCATKYPRITLSSFSLGEQSYGTLSTQTAVINQAEASIPAQIPIYCISKQIITHAQVTSMLISLNLPSNPYSMELDGNLFDYALVSFMDNSRGYYTMSDEEAIEQAWQILRKIPFLEGEYCCTGVRETFVEIDSEGEHVECAGVGFSRVLDGMPVSGEDSIVISFDGGGLMGIKMKLYHYEKSGMMDIMPITEAAQRIQTPDAFSADRKTGKIETLRAEKVKLWLKNQMSDGCTILQPYYVYSGTAEFTDGETCSFSSKIIAVTDRYTYIAEREEQ